MKESIKPIFIVVLTVIAIFEGCVIFELFKCFNNNNVKLSTGEKQVQQEYDDSELPEVVDASRYNVFVTDDKVYIGTWSTAIYVYDKGTKQVDIFKEDTHLDCLSIYGNNIYGIKMANAGVGPICRINIDTGEEETLAEGANYEYAIINGHIYYKYYIKQYEEDEGMEMNLDGTGKKKSVVKFNKEFKGYSNNKEYDLVSKNINMDNFTQDWYLKTPDGEVFVDKVVLAF